MQTVTKRPSFPRPRDAAHYKLGIGEPEPCCRIPAKRKLDDCLQRRSRAYLIGGAYWMPPLLQSELSPRGIFSFDPSPTLRS